MTNFFLYKVRLYTDHANIPCLINIICTLETQCFDLNLYYVGDLVRKKESLGHMELCMAQFVIRSNATFVLL